MRDSYNSLRQKRIFLRQVVVNLRRQTKYFGLYAEELWRGSRGKQSGSHGHQCRDLRNKSHSFCLFISRSDENRWDRTIDEI